MTWLIVAILAVILIGAALWFINGADI